MREGLAWTAVTAPQELGVHPTYRNMGTPDVLPAHTVGGGLHAAWFLSGVGGAEGPRCGSHCSYEKTKAR